MLTHSLLLLSLATIGTSFTLREGLPNGAYRAYYNEAGEEVHELVKETTYDTTTYDTSHYPSLKHRDTKSKRSEESWCGCNNALNAGDTNVANAALADQVASAPVIKAGDAFYVVQNTAVAFVCNKDTVDSNIPSDAVSTGSWDVSDACGLFVAGTTRLPSPQLLDYGYMNYEEGLDFCGQAESALVHNCYFDFYVGGYSGEFETGGPTLGGSADYLKGLWISNTLECSKMSLGSPFTSEVDNVGQEKYEWCDVRFGSGTENGPTLYLGGDGNRCGQVCDTPDACPQGGFFATMYNAAYNGPVGECVWDFNWQQNCASDGSVLYNDLIHCYWTIE